MKRVIINADDLGQLQPINRGIIQSHKFGVVTSSSLMVNMPDAIKAVRLLKAVPNLGVGLHLNLTFGKPVLNSRDVTSLVKDDGTFKDASSVLVKHPELRKNSEIETTVQLMLEELDNHASETDIRAEIVAQFDKFKELTGKLPTHLDTHHHIHRLPKIFDQIASIARKSDIPVRQICPDMKKRLRDLSIKSTDCFIDLMITNHNQLSTYLENLIEIVRSTENGTTEILCHPGYVDDKLKKQTMYSIQREVELRSLCSSLLKEEIKERGIDLINYGEM